LCDDQLACSRDRAEMARVQALKVSVVIIDRDIE
jgi:hypothetical protein